MLSSPPDFLFFMLWITLINSVSIISNRTTESFRLILFLLVFTVHAEQGKAKEKMCGCRQVQQARKKLLWKN
jgi:hypothetical protein